jgi:hypothetical protein
VEELTVLARSNFVDHIWFKIDVKRTWDVFPRRRFGKESAEAVSTVSSHNIVTLKTAIWLNVSPTMFASES